jgi:uncharacterized membrane protein SpoIIM required for sporulation
MITTLAEALIITRREVRDSLRDWRIITPILFLTLIFPYIMNLTTQVALDFVEAYRARIIPLHLIPFAVMIVGFFPISFSLVIALETFVGEKERNSLEPLLASPLSDASLYLGKLLAAMIPPLLGSYLGMSAYLVSLYFSMHYLPDPLLFVQIIIMTTMEALVMVSGAVVISSHTTSVRAANLLASFIIIPMTFLVQGESVLLFWGDYAALWYIMAGLVVVDIILIRTGIRTFNREEILAREVDELNMRRMVERFRLRFLGAERFSLHRVYVEDLPRLLSTSLLPLVVTLLVVLGSFALGSLFAILHPLPANYIMPIHVQPGFETSLQTQSNELLPPLDTVSIFSHNVRTLAISTALAIFSFGSGSLLLLLIPLALIGFLTTEFARVGVNPVIFLSAFVLPHGIIELPAVILGTAFALRLGLAVMAPSRGHPAGAHFIEALADWLKVFVFLVMPLLLVAAVLEVTLTPRIVVYFFGG